MTNCKWSLWRDCWNHSRSLGRTHLTEEEVETILLTYPPACVLVKLNSFSGMAIGDLEEGVVPIFPSEQLIQILVPNSNKAKAKTKTVKWHHLPLMESYALMDYWSQTNNPPCHCGYCSSTIWEVSTIQWICGTVLIIGAGNHSSFSRFWRFIVYHNTKWGARGGG